MNFQEKLQAGEFVITTELCPPKGTDLTSFKAKADILRGSVDAVNVTDNQRAMMRLSPLVASMVLLEKGIEPLYQMTCRDRNALAIQSDLLGASSMGINNILALTGDHITAGNNKRSKAVFDIDSVHLLQTITQLNNGVDINNDEIKGHTNFFAGAAVNPASTPIDIVAMKFEKKIKAGAKFFQTQAFFNADILKQFKENVNTNGTKILAGVLLLKSADMARFLNEKVPGVSVPYHMIEMLEKSNNPLETGIELAAEFIRSLKGIADGVHIMCIGKEEKTIDILNKL